MWAQAEPLPRPKLALISESGHHRHIFCVELLLSAVYGMALDAQRRIFAVSFWPKVEKVLFIFCIDMRL